MHLPVTGGVQFSSFEVSLACAVAVVVMVVVMTVMMLNAMAVVSSDDGAGSVSSNDGGVMKGN